MRTILEIGGGTTPYFVRYDIPWQEGDAYVCIDVDEKRLSDSEIALKKWELSGNRIPRDASFQVADGSATSLPDHSVDEVVLSNVLSAPIHHNFDKAGENITLKNVGGVLTRPIHGSKDEGDLFYRERKALVREALRILRPGGTLAIYNDLIIYGQRAYEKILGELMADMALEHAADAALAEHIDARNLTKIASGDFCYCFDADLLPESSVHRFVKLY